MSGSSHRGCDCSLGDSLGVSYGSPSLSSFVSCSVISSCSSHPLWVLCSVHCLVSLALGWVRFWPVVSTALVRCGVCCLGCPSWLSSFSSLGWSFTCSCGGVVWSHVCDPSCCSCVLGSCGVSLALFCRIGLLRALPCRVFACGFPWFRGSSSWCFSWHLYCGSFLSLPVFTDGSGWWLPALREGSPTSGWCCVLRLALVLVTVPPSLRSALCVRTGFLFSGPGVRVGFPGLLLLCFPSGCGHPLGQ